MKTPQQEAEDILFAMKCKQVWGKDDKSTADQYKRAKECAVHEVQTVVTVLSLHATNNHSLLTHWIKTFDELLKL